jgi:uncharacterized membrane protein
MAGNVQVPTSVPQLFRAHGHLPLWLAPAIGMVLAGASGVAALLLDSLVAWEETGLPVFFIGQPETARVLLAAIAGSVATLIALIFTIIAVVIQLASSQYSPRALYTLLQDRPSHLTIGVLVGTFTYSLVVLVGLGTTRVDGQEIAASLAVMLAFGLAVLSLVTFAIYANHIIHWVRITSILSRHGDNARRALEDLFPCTLQDGPEPVPPPSDPDDRVAADHAGVVTAVDGNGLLRAAVQANCRIVVVPAPGSFVPAGAPLLEIHGQCDDPDALLQYLTLEREPDPERWAFRQLTDIAQRALSPGVNDPATAVQALDQVHDLLRRLVSRDLAHGTRFAADGTVRVFLPVKPWEDVLAETLDEFRLSGEGSLSVMRRLRAVVEDLVTVAPASRKASLDRQLDLLDRAVERSFADEGARDAARRPDRQGTQF